MKRKLLILSMLLATVGFTFAQTTYVDFETNASPTGNVFGNNAYEPGVDNPNTTGNTSAKVGKVVTGSETWSGHAMPIGGTIGFSATDTTFTMDVLSDVTGDVVLKLENASNTSQFVEITATYTTADAWQTLSFNFADTLDAGVYSQLVMFFNFGTTDATTWYFDNVVGPTATFGDDVTVTLNIEDKLEVATTVGLTLEGEEITLTQDGKYYTAEELLSPYTIVSGGGDYEAIISIDGTAHDTATITVSGGDATMTWNYIILIEEPEDGTAMAISVGDTPPTIDGTIDDVWGNAKAHPLQQREWWGSATGLYSYFKIMWDIDNVYILNYVDDKTFYNSAPADAPYENDNVELFFDMDQSASPDFDGNDWQIRGVRGLDTWTGSANVADADWSTAERAQTELADSVGYIMEWAIPWTTLSSAFLPLVDSKFNLDVAVADVADNGGRDYIIAWNTDADINYNNTSKYGVITLSEETSEATSIRSLEQQIEFSIYPNPANNRISVSTKDNISSIQVFDITGKVVAQRQDISTNVASMDVSRLVNGIYLVQVYDEKGYSGVQKLHVK